MNVVKKPTVLLERFPYRYIQVGKLEINGMPDCRIQKVDSYTGHYKAVSYTHLTLPTIPLV